MDDLNRAVDFHRRGMLAEAAALYRNVLARAPDHFQAAHFLGLIEAQHGRLEEAALLLGRAAKAQPADAPTQLNLGNVLLELGRHTEALASFEAALAREPRYAQALNGRGVCQLELGQAELALQSFAAALAGNPAYAEALNNQGNAYQAVNALEDAIVSYRRVVELQPDNAAALVNLGNAQFALRRHAEALAHYNRALAVDPDHEGALYNRGTALLLTDPGAQAVADLARLQTLAPGHDYIAGDVLHARMQICDWRNYEASVAVLDAGVRGGERMVNPFAYQAISASPQDLHACARIYARDKYPAHPGVPARPALSVQSTQSRIKGRIRVGYMSGEFRAQATSFLTAGLFEQHDRSRFEVLAFDNGYDDASAMRARLTRAFDRFIDISRLSDADAARTVSEHGVDILVNLNGYFGLERTGVCARRAAPLQVNYLGFPGTMGAPYVDYLLADRHVIPEDERAHYSEQVVYLPDCYQVNDAARAVAEHTPARAAAGLPEHGFVFCCYNNTYKFTPAMFEVWMRILRRVNHGVLWLLGTSDAARRHLQSAAAQRGIAPERLIFAERVPQEAHLARHRLADLFLDSLPYNAHTTASDALWSGLPVLTATGSAFAGRVATSLLHAVGLPELITTSLMDYEALAVKLAEEPQLLHDLRARLARNRLSCPLFDTARWCRHVEAAYDAMWARHGRGEAPAGFAVAAAPDSECIT